VRRLSSILSGRGRSRSESAIRRGEVVRAVTVRSEPSIHGVQSARCVHIQGEKSHRGAKHSSSDFPLDPITTSIADSLIMQVP